MGLFSDPTVLIWLAASGAAVLAALGWAAKRKENILASLGLPSTLRRLTPPGTAERQAWRVRLQAFAFFLFFLAWAGPQWGVELVRTKGRSRQIVIALDTSLSMAAEDVPPSRIERAKSELAFLIEQMKEDRVGLIAFSGSAQIQCPLTTDRSAAKMFLKAARPDMLPDPGTKIEEAVRLAVRMLSPYPGEKALVIITDAEDHGQALEQAAAEAKAAGVKIYGFIVGTAQGAPIPLRDDAGRLIGYKKDKSGTTVVSRPDEKTLDSAAELTGGKVFQMGPGAANDLIEALNAVPPTEAAAQAHGRFKNRFQWPLGLGLLALLAGWLLPEAAIAAVVILALAASPSSANDGSLLRQAKTLYDRGDYSGAADSYTRALQMAPDDQAAEYGLGSSLYQLKQYPAAADAFQAAAEKQGPHAADALYNLGNAQYRQNQFDKAAQTYRQSVLSDQASPDAKHNFAVALLKLKEPPKKQKQDQKEQQQKQQQQQQKQQNNQDNQQSQPKKQNSGSQQRPRTGMSPEDAQRLLQAVKDREQSAGRPQARRTERKSGGDRPVEEQDW